MGIVSKVDLGISSVELISSKNVGESTLKLGGLDSRVLGSRLPQFYLYQGFRDLLDWFSEDRLRAGSCRLKRFDMNKSLSDYSLKNVIRHNLFELREFLPMLFSITKQETAGSGSFLSTAGGHTNLFHVIVPDGTAVTVTAMLNCPIQTRYEGNIFPSGTWYLDAHKFNTTGDYALCAYHLIVLG